MKEIRLTECFNSVYQNVLQFSRMHATKSGKFQRSYPDTVALDKDFMVATNGRMLCLVERKYVCDEFPVSKWENAFNDMIIFEKEKNPIIEAWKEDYRDGVTGEPMIQTLYSVKDNPVVSKKTFEVTTDGKLHAENRNWFPPYKNVVPDYNGVGKKHPRHTFWVIVPTGTFDRGAANKGDARVFLSNKSMRYAYDFREKSKATELENVSVHDISSLNHKVPDDFEVVIPLWMFQKVLKINSQVQVDIFPYKEDDDRYHRAVRFIVQDKKNVKYYCYIAGIYKGQDKEYDEY